MITLGKIVTSGSFGDLLGFPSGSDSKVSAYSVGNTGSIPGLGRSTGEGNGNPLQYSCLENSMDWGAWWATVHGIAKSRTRLSNFTLAGSEEASCHVINCLWRRLFCKEQPTARKELRFSGKQAGKVVNSASNHIRLEVDPYQMDFQMRLQPWLTSWLKPCERSWSKELSYIVPGILTYINCEIINVSF